MNKSIDIIIPTINRNIEIKECLTSIKNQTIKPNNIIIVDASKNNELHKIIHAEYAKLPIQYIKSDKGLPYQRNIGIKYLKSEWALLLDDDVVLLPNYIEMALKTLEENPKYSSLTGSVINHNRKIKVNPLLVFFQKMFYMSESKIAGFKKSGDYNVNNPALQGPVEVGIAFGCLSMYKSDIFKEYVYDTAYQFLEGYASFEDEDFSLQIRQKYKIVYCTNTRAYHNQDGGKTTRLSIFRGARIKAFNHRLLYRKHKKVYGFKPIPHLISCIGWVIEAMIIKRSVSIVRGLLTGFILFHFKKHLVEKI